MIGWRPLHWWARAVSNCRHLLCKSSALPLSYAPVDEGTAYMDYSPWSQTVAGGSGPAATALVRAARKGRHGTGRDGGSPTPHTVAVLIPRAAVAHIP